MDLLSSRFFVSIDNASDFEFFLHGPLDIIFNFGKFRNSHSIDFDTFFIEKNMSIWGGDQVFGTHNSWVSF